MPKTLSSYPSPVCPINVQEAMAAEGLLGRLPKILSHAWLMYLRLELGINFLVLGSSKVDDVEVSSGSHISNRLCFLTRC